MFDDCHSFVNTNASVIMKVSASRKGIVSVTKRLFLCLYLSLYLPPLDTKARMSSEMRGSMLAVPGARGVGAG